MKFLENPLPTITTIGIYINIDYNQDSAPPYILDIELNLLRHIENSKNLDLNKLKIQLVNKTYLNIVSDRPNQVYLININIYNKAITTPQYYTFKIYILLPTNHIVPDILMRDI